jgi:hypothetical protein
MLQRLAQKSASISWMSFPDPDMATEIYVCWLPAPLFLFVSSFTLKKHPTESDDEIYFAT